MNLRRPGVLALIGLFITAIPCVALPQVPPPGHPDTRAPYLPFEGAWPDRLFVSGQSRGAIEPIDAHPTALASRPVLLPADRPPTESDRDDLALLTSDVSEVRLRPEGPNALVFVRPDKRPRSGIGVGPGPDAGPFGGFSFKFISAQRGTTAGTVTIQRTWFAWYDALDEAGEPAPERAARAALVMPGLFGNPEPVVDRLVLHLRKHGYGVLRMLAQPSRFTERVFFGIEPDRLDDAARRIAGVLGDRAAECAYAAQAARGHVTSQRPNMGGAPWVIIGMSGGAMTLPTVYARDPAAYRAAILIGGTADFWLTNEQSNYRAMVDAIRAAWSEEPTPEQRAALDQAYLSSAPLDSFHTAAALRGRPTLMIQGTIDLAAPSALGDVLWERCGRPERWTYPVGHELLFMGLAQEFDRITGWLDRAISGPGNGADLGAPR